MEISLSDKKIVISYLSKNAVIEEFYNRELSVHHKKIVESIVLIGQADRIFNDVTKEDFSSLESLLSILFDIDSYYRNIGGLKGYHETFLELLSGKKNFDDFSVIEPCVVDFSTKSPRTQEYIDIGLLEMPKMAEIYPLGGAGDRLGLIDEITKRPLPQAKFNFMGKSLLEHLILDLKAREYLYYKTYKEEIITPIVIMTSDIKNNHQYVLDIFEENNFFGRPKESFCFIKQISVPLINEEGNWVVDGKLHLALKPGGHGVLWGLMSRNKVFEWLYTKEREKAIVRQINNPVAGSDYNLLALSGYGINSNKSFGFSSCPRRIGSPEGMNVIKEKRVDDGFEYNVSNIEYTDFTKHNIEDEPEEKASEYSKFPSNTNTLFVDLKAVEKAVRKDSAPGITINMKNTYTEGNRKLHMGRLELLMQSMADNFVDYFPSQISREKCLSLKTFISNNIRRKTIAVIKNPYIDQKKIEDTPLGAYLEVYKNYREILSDNCNVKLPKESGLDEYIKEGPSFICYLNPLLGPIYSDIGEKINGGKIRKGSELRLNLAEVEIEDLYLNGSLVVSGYVEDLKKVSKCILKNVSIKNAGIDRTADNIFYKDQIKRKESLNIILNENSIFEANNITFGGDMVIEVPANYRIKAIDNDGEIFFEKSKI